MSLGSAGVFARREGHLLRGVSATALALAIAVMGVQVGHADEPGSLRPLTELLVFTGQAGTEAPEGSQAVGITLAGVAVTDGLPQMGQANDDYVARLTRGQIPVSEIFDATSDLQRAYRDAGYVLSRVVLPKQSLRNGGTLQVRVLNGYVEAADLSGMPEPVRKRAESLVAPLVNKPGLTRDEIEKQLLLVGEIPGTALEASVRPGASEAGAVVALKAEFHPYTGFVGYDNFLPDEDGTDRLHFGLEANNPFGLGETFYMRLSGAPGKLLSDQPKDRTLTLGLLYPLGSAGTALNLEYTDRDTTPSDINDYEYFDQTFNTSFERFSLRVIHPIKKTQTYSLTGQLALDVVNDREDWTLLGWGDEIAAPIYIDRLTVLRGGLSFDHEPSETARTSGSLVLSKGINALGARKIVDPMEDWPLSRDSAEPTFAKLNGAITHRQGFGKGFNLLLNGRFQTSFSDPLVTSEQFSLVGPSGLSTFDSGTLQGDNGWVVRAELSKEMGEVFPSLPFTVSPYIFAGRGAINLEQSVDFWGYTTERRKINASAYGVGVDLAVDMSSSFSSGSVRIEYGRGERDDEFRDENRVNISSTFRF